MIWVAMISVEKQFSGEKGVPNELLSELSVSLRNPLMLKAQKDL